jgi:hypothetical protein
MECSVHCIHSRWALATECLREQLRARLLKQRKFLEASTWHHILRIINTRLATKRNRLHHIATQRNEWHALINVNKKHKIFPVWTLTDSLMYKIKFDTHIDANTPSSAVGEQSPRAAVCVTQMEESRVE